MKIDNVCCAVTLSKTASLVGHTGAVTDISTGVEGSWLMSSGMDGLIKVRHVTSVLIYSPSSAIQIKKMGDNQRLDCDFERYFLWVGMFVLASEELS